MNTLTTPRSLSLPRRDLLKGAGVLSAGAVLMLAGAGSRAQSASAEGDVTILNVALVLEH